MFGAPMKSMNQHYTRSLRTSQNCGLISAGCAAVLELPWPRDALAALHRRNSRPYLTVENSGLIASAAVATVSRGRMSAEAIVYQRVSTPMRPLAAHLQALCPCAYQRGLSGGQDPPEAARRLARIENGRSFCCALKALAFLSGSADVNFAKGTRMPRMLTGSNGRTVTIPDGWRGLQGSDGHTSHSGWGLLQPTEPGGHLPALPEDRRSRGHPNHRLQHPATKRCRHISRDSEADF